MLLRHQLSTMPTHGMEMQPPVITILHTFSISHCASSQFCLAAVQDTLPSKLFHPSCVLTLRGCSQAPPMCVGGYLNKILCAVCLLLLNELAEAVKWDFKSVNTLTSTHCAVALCVLCSCFDTAHLEHIREAALHANARWAAQLWQG